MKKTYFFFIVLLIFASCKKDKTTPIDTNTVKLTKIIQDRNSGEQLFEYDAQGRIVKHFTVTSGAPQKLNATISYSGNIVNIAYASVSNASLNQTSTVQYTLNSDGNPTLRLQVDRLEFFAPANNPQRTFVNDTLNYEYDAQGLLIKLTKSNRDSTWFQTTPTIVTTTTIITKKLSLYTNTNGNATTMSATGTKSTTTRNPTNTYFNNLFITESGTFDYATSYNNATDYSNVFLLNELNLFFYDVYLMNKKYTKLPSRSIYQMTEKDISGATITSNNSTNDFQYNYNSYGFVINRRMTNAIIDRTEQYIYNK